MPPHTKKKVAKAGYTKEQRREELTKTRIERCLELIKEGILDADPRMLEADHALLYTICNGCGAAGAKIDLIPDTFLGLYIGYACYIHDFDYYLGTTGADRKFADDRFFRNLRSYIREFSSTLTIPRLARSRTYYKSVRIFGEQPFWAGKSSNLLTLNSVNPRK